MLQWFDGGREALFEKNLTEIIPRLSRVQRVGVNKKARGKSSYLEG